MRRVWVEGPHPMAWGCHGCVRAWRQARADVRDGKDAPPWGMLGELEWEDVRRFGRFAEGRRTSHEELPRRERTRLYVRPNEEPV